MTDVKSMTMEELKEFMTKIGEKAFPGETDLCMASPAAGYLLG